MYKNETVESDYVNRNDGVFSQGVAQSGIEDNRDITFNGRLRLRNHTVAPAKGKNGEIIMLNGDLSEWNSSNNAWESVGGGGVASGNGAVTMYIGSVNDDGTTGTPSPTGWTASRTSIGVYKVTHNFGDSTSYIASVDIDDTTHGLAAVYERDANSFDIEITDEDGTYDDADFSYIVIKTGS